ncbi:MULTISPECIES: hypothetical protein [unclassified Blastococcus]
MTDPYDPYRAAPPEPGEVEYEVVYPPLGQPFGTAWAPYGHAAPPPAPAAPVPARPGAVTASAVLALVEGGLLALFAVVWVAVIGGGDGVDGVAAPLLSVLATTAVAALLLVGGLALLRRTGLRLVRIATGVELGLLAVLALWAAVGLAADGSGPGAVGVLFAGMAVAAMPVVRLVLLTRPPAAAWFADAGTAAAAPVWSPVSARWVTPRGPGLPGGLLAAVAVPAALLALVAAVVVGTSGTGSGRSPFAADPYAPGASGSGTYLGQSPWGERYYQDGEALPAPPEGSHLYDRRFDADARDCADGDMGSCDALYWSTPVDDFYEWFGSSCAGRIDRELSGGCVGRLGPSAD